MEILLTSETFVKGISNIGDNIDGKYILPAIREAQEIGLRGIMGDNLLDKIKEGYSAYISGDTGAFPAIYRQAVEMSQYYLAYKTIAELHFKLAYKIVNAGIVQTSDEKVTNATREEIASQKAYYQGKADFYCMRLQTWLYEHRSELPELGDNPCRRIKSNLYSAATSGVFLGGARGKL